MLVYLLGNILPFYINVKFPAVAVIGLYVLFIYRCLHGTRSLTAITF